MRPQKTILVTFFAVMLGAYASAQTTAPTPATPPVPAPEAKSESVQIKETETAPVGIATKTGKDAAGRDTLSVDFPDEEIRNILRNVADLFELNLVIPETLQGKTSIKLRDVTWRQIFQVVLQPVNYSYIEDGTIIRVVDNASLQQEPTTTEVFVLNYAKAGDIQPTISSLIDSGAGGRLVVDSRSNALVITERPSRFNRIRPIIESLDRATDQVMIESKFIEVTDGDVKNIGVNWSVLNGYKVGVGSMTKTWDRNRSSNYSDGLNGSTTVNGSASASATGSSNASSSRSFNSANGTTGSTTATGSSANTNSNSTTTGTTLTPITTTTTIGGVTTQTTSYSVIPTSTSSSSISNSVTGNNTNSSGTTSSIDNSVSNSFSNANSDTNTNSQGSTSVANSLMNLAGAGSTSQLATAVFSANDFNLVLSALQTLNRSKVVSNPTIVTLNNTESTINVGEEYPIPNYTYNQERGAFEVSGFTYKPIGILLKVTPQINSRGFIKLTLEPEVSQRGDPVSFQNASIPIIRTRKTKTQVSLRDGFTMGIGGLISKQATNGATKVPILGDIPIIGNAFKSKTKDTSSTNLMIFITAKIVNSEGASTQEVFDPEQIKNAKLTERELPGYREKSAKLPAEPAKE